MSRLLYTVDNLVEEVRSLIDEDNQDSIDTDSDILPSLNRAQDFAFDILSRKYPEPLLTYQELDLVGGQAEYAIPESVFEDRILKLEVEIPNSAGRSTYRPMQRISYRDLTEYETVSTANVPSYYCIIGRTIRIVATPTGAYNVRMWSLRNPEKLVTPQGRITLQNVVGNYIIVDSAGSSLTTESDQLGSYVNLVDGQTGEIKKSMQILSIQDNKITFRATPLRSTVLNRTISGSYTAADFGPDDYVAPIDGICVPYYGRPITNFLVQFSVAEMTGKLGGTRTTEEEILKKFEQQVERTWIGRERQMRVQKRATTFGVPVRRWYWE